MRRRDNVEAICSLFKELWDELAVEAAVSTFSTLCSDEQLEVLRTKLENDVQRRKDLSNMLTVAESRLKQ
jgi:hypothetical protein